MAIPRMFDSNAPFVVVTGGSQLSFVAKEKGQGCDEEKDSLAQAIAPHLSRLLERGTAKQLGAGGQSEPEESPYVSIIAQAEGEEGQEFSPTRTQCQYSRSQQLKKRRFHAKKTAVGINAEDEESDGNPALPQHRLRRKHRRKSHTMRRKHRREGEERPIIQGLWVQEIDWLSSVQDDAMPSPVDIIPPPPQFTDWIADDSGAFRTSVPNEELTSCYSGEDLYDDRLEGASLSDDPYCPNSAADSPSVAAGRVSDSARRPGWSEGDWGCVGTQESGSESSSRGGSSGSVCSLRYASDSFLSTCVSDSFRVGTGASDSTFELMRVSDFTTSTCEAECGFETSTLEDVCSDSVPSLLGISDSTFSPIVASAPPCREGVAELPRTDTVLGGLRGRVTEMPKQFVSPFFKDLVKHSSSQRNINAPTNEGIVFHNQLRPNKHKYREGKEYCVLHHIQNGSYGDVYCVRDNSTGFLCAAKRIPLSHFSSEEVSTWSALNSPRVVELFGAVREDLNVVLFMDLKPGCLAQLVRDRSSIPEDLALHYLCQLLGALEHLHLRHVLHLDIKVDNVLLSANSRDTFLCDFGLSETLDHDGQRTSAFRGSGFHGTETHMAPEVARGDQLCGKADIWSSCCMLLHMLNGCHPWIRYYAHPLCLTIANEPPPLWEVPSNCNHFTAKVLRAGLKKDPERRAPARELQKKTTKALRAVGGLSRSSLQWACEKLDHGKSHNGDIPCTLSSRGVPAIPAKPGAGSSAPAMHWVSPWRTRAADEDSCDGGERDSELDQDSEAESTSSAKEWSAEPKSLQDGYVAEDRDWETGSDSEVDIYMGEDEERSQERGACPKHDWDYEGDWEEEEEEEEDCDSSSSTGFFHTLQAHFPVLRQGLPTAAHSWGSEPELEYLREGVTIGTTLQSPSPEPRDHPPSCFSCSDTSQIDASDKDSDGWSDDLSSGVFSSYNSQTEGHLEWLVISANQPSLNCLEGVDIWIENIHGECLRIRERRQVKVGHVAIGISDQISAKTFSMETLDRKMVSFEQEIKESGLWLRCVPAPDGCQRWTWRINDGRLELRE